MFDRKGRVWSPRRPAVRTILLFAKRLDHPSAKVFPVERSNRHFPMLDPKTMKYTFVETCFNTHHLQFDANDVLWASTGGANSPVIGWLDMKIFDETGDAAKAQGWTPLILDTNGNGKRDEYVEPNQPVDPTKDKRIVAGFNAVMPSRPTAPSGVPYGLSLARSCASLRGRSPRRRRSRRSTMLRCRASVSAAPISTNKA